MHIVKHIVLAKEGVDENSMVNIIIILTLRSNVVVCYIQMLHNLHATKAYYDEKCYPNIKTNFYHFYHKVLRLKFACIQLQYELRLLLSLVARSTIYAILMNICDTKIIDEGLCHVCISHILLATMFTR